MTKKENMKKIALGFCALLGIGITMNATADDRFRALSLDSAESTESGAKKFSYGFTGLVSARPTQYYGVELQLGYFNKSFQFTNNTELDLSGIGLLPFGGSGIKLYGKAGLADVYSWASSSAVSNPSKSVNKVGLTYGAGIEYQLDGGAIRVGYQHFNIGKYIQASPLRTNLIGMTFLAKY